MKQPEMSPATLAQIAPSVWPQTTVLMKAEPKRSGTAAESPPMSIPMVQKSIPTFEIWLYEKLEWPVGVR